MSIFGNIKNQLSDKYVGTQWKWIKEKDGVRPGEPATIVDISKAGAMHMAKFDNGQKLNIEMLSEFVSPVTPGVEPPPKPAFPQPDKKKSPSAPPGSTAMDDMQGHGMSGGKHDDDLDYPGMRRMSANGPLPNPVNNPVNESMVFNTQPGVGSGQSTPVVKKSDIFDMFDAPSRDISLKVTLEMPEIKLLRMMYQNANDKNEFAIALSNYVLSNIKTDQIRTAIEKLLGVERAPAPRKRRASGKRKTPPSNTKKE